MLLRSRGANVVLTLDVHEHVFNELLRAGGVEGFLNYAGVIICFYQTGGGWTPKS